MIPVFIQNCFSNKEMKDITDIIFKYKAYIVDSKDQANIIIQKNITIFDFTQATSTIMSKRFLNIMDNEMLNPFLYKSQSKCLMNNYLLNKTFSFLHCSQETISRISPMI